jgi:hypothetical protein
MSLVLEILFSICRKASQRKLLIEHQQRRLARELGYLLVRLFTKPQWTKTGGQYDKLLARVSEWALADTVCIEALAGMEKGGGILEVARFIESRGYRCVHHGDWEPLATRRFLSPRK